MATPATSAKPRAGRKPGPARPDQPPARIQIQYPAPAVDGGEFPVKRCVGDAITVSADIFRDGHDLIRAMIRYRGPGEDAYRETELHRIDQHLGGVRWSGSFAVERIGTWEFTIEAWTDVFGTWRDELERKVTAGQHDLQGELSEGLQLLETATARAGSDEDRRLIEHAARTLSDEKAPESAKHDVALGVELHAAVERTQERHGVVTLKQPLTVEVDRLRARFGSWYELFPRSWGGLKGVQEQLPRL